MNPTWVQAGATVVLVCVTSYYAYQIRKSNENIWKLEEERRKHKKMGLRKSIIGELHINDLLLDDVTEDIEKFKKQYISKLSLILKFPESTTYRSIICDIGMLEEEEMEAIMYIYKIMQKIGTNYIEIQKASESANYKSLDILINELEKDISYVTDFCDNLNKSYKKLFRGEIDAKGLNRELGDLK